MPFDPGYYAGSTISGADEMNQIAAKPSPEDLRKFINDEMQNADEVVNRQRAADDFVALYKPRGYKDTIGNSRQIVNALNLLGKTNPTTADFEDIFMRLKANAMLDLDESKLNAMEKQEEKIRIAQYLDNQFDPAKAEAMSMDELRSHAFREADKAGLFHKR